MRDSLELVLNVLKKDADKIQAWKTKAQHPEERASLFSDLASLSELISIL